MKSHFKTLKIIMYISFWIREKKGGYVPPLHCKVICFGKTSVLFLLSYFLGNLHMFCETESGLYLMCYFNPQVTIDHYIGSMDSAF